MSSVRMHTLILFFSFGLTDCPERKQFSVYVLAKAEGMAWRLYSNDENTDGHYVPPNETTQQKNEQNLNKCKRAVNKIVCVNI